MREGLASTTEASERHKMSGRKKIKTLRTNVKRVVAKISKSVPVTFTLFPDDAEFPVDR